MIKFDRKTDKIAFIAPASGANDKSGQIDLNKSYKRLEETIALYENHGFNCVYDEQIFSKSKLGYFSSPKLERLRQLQNALLNPDVKIIAAFRGGYGCTEIVFDCMGIVPTTPKVLIGFSDVTALHFLFNQKYKLPTIHGAMGIDHKPMIEEVINVLGGKETSFNLAPINKKAELDQEISGEIIGGNLTIVINMIGTELHPKFNDRIVFIEDVGEKGYHVHRYLMHMKNSRLFEGIKAIIFADFTNSDEHLEESIAAFSKEYLKEIPAFTTSGIGHGKINSPVVIGGKSQISDLKLKITSPFQTV
jgi:muramoyltetrapeptide carboxypeptidase LdcA involved in peptidoglycan recycling